MTQSSSFEKLNTLTTVFFSIVNSGATISGILDSSFTKRLWNPSDVDIAGTGVGQIPVTVTELGSSGRYYATYTNDASEEWLLSIVHPTYAPTGLDAVALVYSIQHGDSNDSSAVLDFYVGNGSTPITGLVTGDFTFELWNPAKSDVSGSVSVTIVELGNGDYRAKFSAATAEGDWFIAIKHSLYFPTGVTGVWRYIVPDISDVPGQPTIVTLTNDNTGVSATAALLANDPTDELFMYYRLVPEGAWALFAGSRIGSGDLQITGLLDNLMHEMICIASRSASPLVAPSLPSEPKRVFITDSETALTSMMQALYDWVADAMPWSVAWIPSNAPQIKPPSIAIRMRPLARIGDDYHSQPDEVTSIDTIIGDREFMFEAEFLGVVSPDGIDPTFDYAEQLVSSLQKDSVVSTLSAAGIAPVETLPTQDLTAVASTKWQSRALVEVRFRIGYTTQDVVNWVETADQPSGTVIP